MGRPHLSPANPEKLNGVSAGKRDQIEIFFKKKFLSKIDVDLIIWSRTFIISKKNFLSIWSLFPALTPFVRICQIITFGSNIRAIHLELVLDLMHINWDKKFLTITL